MHLTRILIAAALVGVQILAAGPANAQQTTLTTSGWSPGPDGSGQSTYQGTVDQPTGTSQLAGWIVDTTAQGWSGIDDVLILDGLMQAGGQLVAHPVIQLNRPDVAATLSNPFWTASGYAASLAPNRLAALPTLYVYGHTPAKGWWYQQISMSRPPVQFAQGPTLDIETPTSLGTVHSATPFTVRGSAYDPNAGTNGGVGVDRVQVYLDGDRTTGTYIGDATLGKFDAFVAVRTASQFANAGWQLVFQPNSWLSNLSDNQVSKLTVYARSSITGAETQQQTAIVISVP